MVLPVLELLSKRKGFLHEYTCDVLNENSNIVDGTLLHAALKSTNLPLIMLIVDNLEAIELKRALELQCSLPVLNTIVDNGISHYTSEVYRFGQR